ncbi:MAG: DUF448 domain-containing protein [Actinobacteria bacterium]|nr:DUF448 domain-containing protein [Actinomycetota bacterium]
MNAVRTCIGCRSTDNRSSLVRLVVVGGGVEVDHSASAPGRGAWLHASHQCLEQAITRRTFSRALRQNRLDTSRLENEWKSFTHDRE